MEQTEIRNDNEKIKEVLSVLSFFIFGITDFKKMQSEHRW